MRTSSPSPSRLLDPTLAKALAKEKTRFEQTDIPIITVSASYKEDVKGFYGYPEDETLPDVVFSRAHYSMSLALAVTAWQKKLDPSKAYVVDPTNFVHEKDWQKILFTEFVGKTLAREPLLKRVKDFIDQFGRSKLPILSSIEGPILELTRDIQKPILSMHIAAGNMLVEQGKTVLQVITDPHVRAEYLTHADSPNLWYCVFDEATKLEALEKAAFLNKQLDPNRVIVSGPPVDPRVIAVSKQKKAWRNEPLRLCITTGGLGTNKYEIRQLLLQLLPELRKRKPTVELELLVYASTHNDIATMVNQLAREHKIKLETISRHVLPGSATPERSTRRQKSSGAKLRLIYHPQLVDANELLIEHAFPWADGFITKPSGDMAYDAAAAGCFLLTLSEWGEWEHNIRERFESLGIARKAATQEIVDQLAVLTNTHGRAQSWVEQAMHQAITLESNYRSGTENILKTYRKLTQSKH